MLLTDMEDIQDIRKDWTEEEWNKYYQSLAEQDAERELDDEQYNDIMDECLGI